eukprot:6461593-Amphidinium_carterae.1
MKRHSKSAHTTWQLATKESVRRRGFIRQKVPTTLCIRDTKPKAVNTSGNPKRSTQTMAVAPATGSNSKGPTMRRGSCPI